MWPKFIFPIVIIVYYWLLFSLVSLSTHFAVLRLFQCLLTFTQLFSVQKCNITGRVNLVGHGGRCPITGELVKFVQILKKGEGRGEGRGGVFLVKLVKVVPNKVKWWISTKMEFTPWELGPKEDIHQINQINFTSKS